MTKERRGVSLDPENDAWLDQQDNASAVINRLVKHARKTGNREMAGLDLQIQQKRRELQTAKERVENIQRDLDELENMRRRLEQEESAELQQARQALEGLELEPSNPGVQNWADKLGMTEQELIDRLTEQP